MVKSKLRSKINSSNRLHNRLCSGLSLVQAQLNSPLWKMRISMLCWHPVAYMKLSLFHLVKHSRTLFWNNFWKTEKLSLYSCHARLSQLFSFDLFFLSRVNLVQKELLERRVQLVLRDQQENLALKVSGAFLALWWVNWA